MFKLFEIGLITIAGLIIVHIAYAQSYLVAIESISIYFIGLSLGYFVYKDKIKVEGVKDEEK